MRRHVLAIAAAAALGVTACGGGGGGDDAARSAATPAGQSPPGKLSPTTADGRSNEVSAKAGERPVTPSVSGTRTDQRRGRPCSLVSTAQARAILGAAIEKPIEAAQGPTCIYRTRDGEGFVSVSVQTLDFTSARKKLAQSSRLKIADHTAYCGMYGRSMLYADVADGYVLSVAGPCDVAERFAGEALQKLIG